MDLLLSIAVGLLMFSLGLTLDFKDFKEQIKSPKAIIIGVCSQLILPVLIALLLIYIFGLTGKIAMGVMLGASVPWGATSALITYRSKGDTALSVSLTSINSVIITLISLPLLIYYSYNTFLGAELANIVHTSEIILKLFLITILPIIVSLLIQYYSTTVANKLKKILSYYMILYYVIVVGIGIFVLIQDFNLYQDYFVELISISVIANLFLMIVGYMIASGFQLTHKQSKTIAIETSFQNNNLAFALAISVIQISVVGVPSLFYWLVMTVIGLIIIFIEKRRRV